MGNTGKMGPGSSQGAKGVGGCSSPLTADIVSPGKEEVAMLVITYPNAQAWDPP